MGFLNVLLVLFGLSNHQTCLPSEFQCSNGRCVASHFVCEGIELENCWIGGDESQCNNAKKWIPIPTSWVCEEKVCDEKTEETCPCSKDEIWCPDPVNSITVKTCIKPGWSFDNDRIWDCPDGWDEITCTLTLNTPYSKKNLGASYSKNTSAPARINSAYVLASLSKKKNMRLEALHRKDRFYAYFGDRKEDKQLYIHHPSFESHF